jgi:hypothetical protein
VALGTETSFLAVDLTLRPMDEADIHDSCDMQEEVLNCCGVIALLLLLLVEGQLVLAILGDSEA